MFMTLSTWGIPFLSIFCAVAYEEQPPRPNTSLNTSSSVALSDHYNYARTYHSGYEPAPDRPESTGPKRSKLTPSEASEPQVRAALNDHDLWRALVDWVIDHDGFVSGKIDLMPAPDGGVSSGMVATEDIGEREVIVDIPVKCHLIKKRLVPMADIIEDVDSIPSMSLQHPSFTTWLAIAIEDNINSSHPVWPLYLEKLGRDRFSHMPYWQNQANLKIFLPSPEHYSATRSEYWYSHDHIKIINNVKRKKLRTFEKSRFINASMALGTRAYSTPYGEGMVPVADMFNHAIGNNAQWIFSTDADSLRIWALRPIPKGAEITVSYGERTNPVLLSVYGFTIHPAREPFQGFRIWCPKFTELHKSFSIANLQVDMRITTRGLEEGFGILFMEAVTQNFDSIQMLNATVNYYLEMYRIDPVIQAARETWERNVALDSNTTIWWRDVDQCSSAIGQEGNCEDQDLSEEWGGGDIWRTHVIRAKMSEYVCLVAHEQLFEIYAGTRNPNAAILPARTLFTSLMDFLKELATSPPAKFLQEQGKRTNLAAIA